METVAEEETQGQNPVKPENEVNISYETLFEMLRIEKNRDDLQQLPSVFFEDVLAYLREKQQILDESRVKEDLFSATERDKVSAEMANMKKILRELYERREKKIINMALNKSRTKSNIIDTSKLMKEEIKLFDSLVQDLDMFRSGIIMNVLDMRQPYVYKKAEAEASAAPASEEVDGENGGGASGEKPAEVKKDTKLVRFLHAVPKFVGKELETYGPFEEEDMATLPAEIAELLISKERAEEITEG